jgi:hypothetical protein
MQPDKTDMRTALGKYIQGLRGDLFSALGGVENVSPQNHIVVGEIVKKKIQSDRLAFWHDRASRELLASVEKLKKGGNGIDKETVRLLITLGNVLGSNSDKWLAASNSLRLDLLAIGLGRRARDIETWKQAITKEEGKGDEVLDK